MAARVHAPDREDHPFTQEREGSPARILTALPLSRQSGSAVSERRCCCFSSHAGVSSRRMGTPAYQRTSGASAKLGGEVLGEATGFENGRAVYCREPSGTVLELFEPRPG